MAGPIEAARVLALPADGGVKCTKVGARHYMDDVMRALLACPGVICDDGGQAKRLRLCLQKVGAVAIPTRDWAQQTHVITKNDQDVISVYACRATKHVER
uniref:Uncharacterized protein n=1 Tax=Haptolina ericina TaxID=156174 RepID=A0A7S3BKJ2_9EUKA